MRSEVSRPQSVVAGGGTFRSAMASARAPQQHSSSASGPIRRAGIARGARESAAPYQQHRPARATESVFDRLGERERERGERDGHFGALLGCILVQNPCAKSKYQLNRYFGCGRGGGGLWAFQRICLLRRGTG